MVALVLRRGNGFLREVMVVLVLRRGNVCLKHQER
jgi:hypothetical protein